MLAASPYTGSITLPALTVPSTSSLTPALFSVNLPVWVEHLNYGNHLGHDRLISIMHEARLQYFSTLGVAELPAPGATATGLIVSQLAVDYLGEAFYGDTLKIDLFARDISRVRFVLDYRITCREHAIARASVTLAAFDYHRHRPVALPPKLKHGLTQTRVL